MSEEDKEFIKSLKFQCECARKNFKDTCCELPILYVEKMINIIEKQQKEIEEWKEIYNNLSKTYDFILENDFIEKDKIREKIKEIDNGTYDAKIILMKLLEE